ncbi:ferritin-like protein [Photobacterium sp. TY1-4]|uniref:ferritin-like protein n=1 Tax=Photobacterium sp. TY1-4 TaxID=2899122 RepID=UPI0021BE49DE|nr:ferritin-like protein [Photobacterium sp. TY1-4]UXI03263.1 ferritin-like protein [Photobacterium sp. TY1-4]
MQSNEIENIKQRDVKYLQADIACVKAIAQAAVNVELFTIPLYMTALYSVQGMHQINSKGSTLYTGRWWPGSAPTAGEALTTNAQVFNKVYSVFVAEMLHLQLASNMASTLGFTPVFTSSALQSEDNGWQCYNNTSQIPHILDFSDWKGTDPDLSQLKVALRAMDSTQVELFLAIEETEDRAREMLRNPQVTQAGGTETAKYFEEAPYNWFSASMTENDLPMFGSIGHMYLCYWQYLEIEYSDGSTLLGHLLAAKNGQRDQFNNVPPRNMQQYPGIDATIGPTLDEVKIQLINNINAITDQGEGADVVKNILERWSEQSWVKVFQSNMLNAVQQRFQPDKEALNLDYPGYDDEGNKTTLPSGSAQARFENGDKDHFELFEQVKTLISQPDYLTWDQWHQQHPDTPWTADMLGKDGAPNLPSTEAIADALNRLNSVAERDNTYQLFSQAAVGTIKGITTALNRYWAEPDAEFPSPAMGGSGDRISICWAVTGRCPDLVTGIANQQSGTLYHACQGMAMYPETGTTEGKEAENSCANVLSYHSCKGSNECKTQGGCGFVQSASGGGSCSSSAAKGLKSAPADNLCGGFGGCAVPISASQLFPHQVDNDYRMQLYTFGPAPDFPAEKTRWPQLKARDMLPPVVQYVDAMPYQPGEAVYDVAWRAYCEAKGLIKVTKTIHGDKIEIPEPPQPSDIRLAMPPST